MAISLGVVGIAVKDMAASLRFYRLLEIEVPAGNDTESHVEASAGGIKLAWDTVEEMAQVYPSWVDQPVGHRIELAFQCASAAEVDATHRRIVAAGYRSEREPWDAVWGQRYAIVEDPDGNCVSLFA